MAACCAAKVAGSLKFVLIWVMASTGDVLQVVESLYGQDLDSGHHGSGFPLPPFRQTMLEHHLTQAAQDKGQKDPGSAAAAAQRLFTDKETAYSKHAWNINNLPRCKVRLPWPDRQMCHGDINAQGISQLPCSWPFCQGPEQLVLEHQGLMRSVLPKLSSPRTSPLVHVCREGSIPEGVCAAL